MIDFGKLRITYIVCRSLFGEWKPILSFEEGFFVFGFPFLMIFIEWTCRGKGTIEDEVELIEPFIICFECGTTWEWIDQYSFRACQCGNSRVTGTRNKNIKRAADPFYGEDVTQ